MPLKHIPQGERVGPCSGPFLPPNPLKSVFRTFLKNKTSSRLRQAIVSERDRYMDGLERSKLVILWVGRGEPPSLFTNAIQAMDGKGALSLSTKSRNGMVAVPTWSYRLWKFQGICEKNIHPFFTIKTLGKGTGLGLYAVKSLVTQYQGKVSVDTEVEKGTTFKLEFPALSQT